jgi:hypothetical protein
MGLPWRSWRPAVRNRVMLCICGSTGFAHEASDSGSSPPPAERPRMVPLQPAQCALRHMHPFPRAGDTIHSLRTAWGRCDRASNRCPDAGRQAHPGGAAGGCLESNTPSPRWQSTLSSKGKSGDTSAHSSAVCQKANAPCGAFAVIRSRLRRAAIALSRRESPASRR